MKTLLRVIKALSDRNRVRIVAALGERELCVCQIVELLKLAHSTVSKHLAILDQADIVECRKDGRWIYYRLAGTKRAAASKLTALIIDELQQDELILKDKTALKVILRMNTGRLCSLQKQRRES